MGDILTQIQDELDQMHAALAQIAIHAPPSPIPSQPTFSTDPATQSTQPTQSASTQPTQPSSASAQDAAIEKFRADIAELSRDMVTKEQQLEYLIERLPGIGTSERQQVERMRELEGELEGLEGERQRAVEEKASMARKIEGLVGGVGGMG
ncbi:hypothetical protein EJ04DRAFT_535870 [Polyplosphaeria fusca]|uniref:Mediator of RNA polymerase II transcription subunit 21 n=1 Tax=Polyplosphaeria fusca TaxID=682080 RepID=A0A9P4UZQ9_9PLEO|nr:hypothetical protein EJ04DRAFT_535870 [Polyplosphaeria fusca]